jgi:hypothetical protein
VRKTVRNDHIIEISHRQKYKRYHRKGGAELFNCVVENISPVVIDWCQAKNGSHSKSFTDCGHNQDELLRAWMDSSIVGVW